MSLHDYEKEVEFVFTETETRCEAGRALRIVLDALVDANYQGADTDENDEQETQRRSDAELFLFQLANKLTNGYREKLTK